MRHVAIMLCATALALPASATQVVRAQTPVGTAFTYQGQLKRDGVPFNGTVDIEFTLWDAQADGSLLEINTIEAVSILDGLFTVALDYGTDVFNGSASWIEVAVRSPAGVGEYVPLVPRQRITPTPYAIALPGLHTQQNDTSPNLIGGHMGNAVEVDVVGATIGGGGVALEAEPPQPNLVTDNFGTIGGGFGNTAGDSDADATSVEAATVGGGRNNQAGYRLATVSGGASNVARGLGATVGGGLSNQATLMYTTVAGGQLNEAKRSGVAIGGGRENVASGENSAISGGHENTVSVSGNGAVIGGGSYNSATNNYTTIAGGEDNEASGTRGTVSGGTRNAATGSRSSVGGGSDNVASGTGSTVVGGYSNAAGGDYSFAGGYGAVVRDAAATEDFEGDEGTFVWADSNTPFLGPFTSTGPNQFLIRALGGVGIGTNAPVAHLDLTADLAAGTWLNLKNTSSGQRYLFQVNGTAPAGDPGREGSLEIWGTGASGNHNVFTATPDGKVGINTAYPANALTVGGAANFSGFVGIGTATPTANLEVVSASTLSTSLNIVNTSSAQQFLCQVNGSHPGGQDREGNFEILGLGSSATYPVLTATPDGKVGVNTYNPRNSFSVDGVADFNGSVGIGTATPGYSVPSSKLDVSGGHIAVSNNYGVFSSNGTGNAIGAGFDTGHDDALDLYAGGGKKVRITPSGEVGIGTDNPGSAITNATLDIAGGHVALSNSYGVLSANSAGNGIGAGFDTLTDDSLDLWAGGAARVHLTTFGNLGVGTTSPSFRLQSVHTLPDVGSYPLQIANKGDTAGTTVGMLFQVGEGGVAGKGAIAYESTTDWNRGDLHFLQNSSASPGIASIEDSVMTIKNGGWIGVGTTTPGAHLDITSENPIWTGVNIKNLASDQRYLIQVNGTQPEAARAGNLEIWGTGSGGNHNVFTAASNGNTGIRNQTPEYPLQVGTTALDGNGAHVTAGGVWTNGSDRDSKRNFERVDKKAILEKVVDLSVTRWQYKGENDAIRHIGPVAQDFHEAFGLGGSDKHIGTLDADGVALAAIQGLHETVKEKDAKIASLERRLEALERTVHESRVHTREME